jgi:MFS family permease
VYELDAASLRSARTAASTPPPRVTAVVWYLGFVSFFTDISSEMVSSVLPIYLLVQLQLSPLQFGIVDGLYQGVGAIARLASGFVSDRWGRHKIVAAIGYGISAVCKLGLLAVGSAPAALATLISIDRTGKGLRTAPRDALISLNTRDSDLGAAFGVHRALDAAGVVVGPLLAYLILRATPGRFDAIFVVSFAAAIIGLGVLLLLVDDVHGAASPGSRKLLSDFRALTRHRGFISILVTGVMLNVAVMSDAFLYLMLLRRSGMDTATLPLLFMGTACAYLALAVPFGRLADRAGRARVFVGGYAIVAGIYGAALVVDLGTPGLIACLVIHGAYYAATDGVLAALASSVVPAGLRASGLASVGTATSVAKLGGSILLGALWSWAGPSAVLGFGCVATLAVLALAYAPLTRADGSHSGANA